MKRIFLLLLVLTTLLSCNKQKNTNENVTHRKIDNLLEMLKDRYSNYESNEIVRSDFEVDLNTKVDSIFENKVFDDIPLSVFKIYKNKYGPGMIVHLYSDNKFNTEESPSNFITFDLYGFISEDKAKKINEGMKYYVKGHNVHRINHQQSTLLAPMTYYSNYTKIEKDAFNDNYLFNLGHAIMEVDRLVLVN